MPPPPRSHPSAKVEEEIPISVLAIEEHEETI
jgi:hypothetical protein